MAVFNKSVSPSPYVCLFPKSNVGGVVRLDINNNRISCFQEPTTMKVHIEYTMARLYKNKCMGCEFLFENSDDSPIDTDNVPEGKCPGFNLLHPREKHKCIKKYTDTQLEVVSVNTPTLVWSVDRYNKYKLYTVKSVGGILYKTPYTLANVYSNGDICWGTGNKGPGNIREASINYWSLPFNYDLMIGNRADGDLITKLTTFEIPDDNRSVLENWHDTTDIFGNACVYTSKQTDGVVIWFNEEMLSLLPKDRLYGTKRTLNNSLILDKCAVSWVKYLADSKSYLLDFNGFKIVKEKLTLKSKTTVLGELS